MFVCRFKNDIETEQSEIFNYSDIMTALFEEI